MMARVAIRRNGDSAIQIKLGFFIRKYSVVKNRQSVSVPSWPFPRQKHTISLRFLHAVCVSSFGDSLITT